MIESKVFMLVQTDQLKELIENAVRKALEVKKEVVIEEQTQLGEYVPQVRAMKILNRKTTWFHNKRKSGELIAVKSANQWWYKRSDLEEYVVNGTSSTTTLRY